MAEYRRSRISMTIETISVTSIRLNESDVSDYVCCSCGQLVHPARGIETEKSVQSDIGNDRRRLLRSHTEKSGNGSDVLEADD